VIRLPDFIIIGAMKCATSTLHEQLAAQDGIFMSTPKEPNFFSDHAQFARGFDWYCSLFRPARASDRCGESSTHYTKLPTYKRTVERMDTHLGRKVKLIYVMRHPIDRLVSQYIHEWTQRAITVPIDDAVEKHPELVEYGRYAMQLEPFLETFGCENVLPVFFEHLTAEPQKELERVCRFIGYRRRPRWTEEAGQQNVSEQRLRKSKVVDVLMNCPGSATIRHRFVPQSVRDRIKGLWTMKERPQLSGRRIEELRRIYDRDLTMLGRWLGLDLCCDTFKDIGRTTAAQWAAGRRETVP
jgi:hypothetical protein